MSITTDRIARKPNGVGGKTAPLDDHVKSYLFDALGSTLDSIVIGVVIVGEQGRILHANQAAQRMFAARSPIVSLGGCLCALQGELTKELRRAIATAQQNPNSIAGSGIGVPLVDKNLAAATAHVLPLACQRPPYIGCRRGVRDAGRRRVAGRDRHRGTDFQPDAGGGAAAPASRHRREPHRGCDRARHHRGDGANAP